MAKISLYGRALAATSLYGQALVARSALGLQPPVAPSPLTLGLTDSATGWLPAPATEHHLPLSFSRSIPQPGFAGMPYWYKTVQWAPGELASLDDYSLHVAALLEYYSTARHNHATGLAANSSTKAFAVAAAKACERAHSSSGGGEAYKAMPDAAKNIKLMEYIQSASWPKHLDHWCHSMPLLLASAHGLFVYSESRGEGRDAERELLGAPPRARAAIGMLHPLKGVLAGCPDYALYQASLRALVVSHLPRGAQTHCTLDNVISVNAALSTSMPHCSGAEFDARSFAERVRIAKELVEKQSMLRHLTALGGASASTAAFGDAGGSGSTSSKVAGYDRLRLEKLKDNRDYNEQKSQILSAVAAGELDKAMLVALRGAEISVGGKATLMPPCKAFHDLVLGGPGLKEIEVYSVDKDLEVAITAMRRNLPAFFGRRTAKALYVDKDKAVPLEDLANSMRDTSKWLTTPVDFYNLAFVPIRVANGDAEEDLHATFGYTPGTNPYENPSIVAAISYLAASILRDMGVHSTETVDDYSTVTAAKISSTQDVFGLLSHDQLALGAMPRTSQQLGNLFTGLLRDFGQARHSVRASVDPMRPINQNFVEASSVRLAEYFRDRLHRESGRNTVRDLRLAGYTVVSAHAAHYAASPRDADERKETGGGKREAALTAEVEQLKKQLKQQRTDKTQTKLEDKPPASMSLLDDGKRAHVIGGDRGGRGCFYLLHGAAGVDEVLKRRGVTEVGPAWFVAKRSGLEDAAVAAACKLSKHPADANPPSAMPESLKDVKLVSFRINEDGSRYEFAAPSAGRAAGAGRGGRSRGRGGKGRAIVVAAGLGTGNAFSIGTPPCAEVVATGSLMNPSDGLAFGGGVPATATANAELLRNLSAQLHACDSAHALQEDHPTAGLPLSSRDAPPARWLASSGPVGRARVSGAAPAPQRLLSRPAAPPLTPPSGTLAPPSGTLDLASPSGGSPRFDAAMFAQSLGARTVHFAAATPPTGLDIVMGQRGIWCSSVGTAPWRGGLEPPPVFACREEEAPSLATVLVPVRTDSAASLVLKPQGDSLFGLTFDDEPSRDAAVGQAERIAPLLLGPACEYSAYLAGEWVDSHIRWRVIVCVLGGPLRPDMAEAQRDGMSQCGTCRCACWLRVPFASGGRADDVSLAALARALTGVAPSSHTDARLRVGRGEETWVDPFLGAVSDSPTPRAANGHMALHDVASRMAETHVTGYATAFARKRAPFALRATCCAPPSSRSAPLGLSRHRSPRSRPAS